MRLYRYEVLASSGHPTRKFYKHWSGEEEAENFRKTEEVLCGFRVVKYDEGAVDAFENTSPKPVVEELSVSTPTPIVKEVQVSTSESSVDFPKNWHRKANHVTSDGTVYSFGKKVS